MLVGLGCRRFDVIATAKQIGQSGVQGLLQRGPAGLTLDLLLLVEMDAQGTGRPFEHIQLAADFLGIDTHVILAVFRVENLKTCAVRRMKGTNFPWAGS